MPLLWAGGNDKLLTLYGEHRYSEVWTFNQAWASGVRLWDSGNHDEASPLFGRLRQEMLQIHMDLYPEDARWRNDNGSTK